MKKVVFIGMCGHSMQAYDVLKSRDDVLLCGVAAGSEHEGMMGSFDEKIPFFASYTEMLDSVRPDLAVVSPVFGLTGKVVLACAARGIDIFSEKPVAGSLSELDEVEKAVKEAGIRFCAMHYLRVSPAFWQGARMVADGEIGEVRLLSAQKSYRFGTRPTWYSDRALFTGIIPWVGIHAIDWIYAFSRKRFLSVNAQVYGAPEMAASCRFEMEDGVMSTVTLDYYRPMTAPTHGDDRIRCVGTRGILEVRDDKILLMNESGVSTVECDEAPELLTAFLEGEEVISAEEIFYLTRVALIARESADTKQTTFIGEKA
ncbi:MAG: Gfo/Idh/MocA family oxidoreductase [Ruminococcaceae bacterium]|nr:Gfo/Idh/MocA family oxidoreductase [Oscillospiraceae bacterium]